MNARCIIGVLLSIAGSVSASAQTGVSLSDSANARSNIQTTEYSQLQVQRSIMTTPKPVSENYYAKHLGFFCRQELKLQQKKIPVTFRVGSMEQCNRLEQKPGYR